MVENGLAFYMLTLNKNFPQKKSNVCKSIHETVIEFKIYVNCNLYTIFFSSKFEIFCVTPFVFECEFFLSG